MKYKNEEEERKRERKRTTGELKCGELKTVERDRIMVQNGREEACAPCVNRERRRLLCIGLWHAATPHVPSGPYETQRSLTIFNNHAPSPTN